jgi:radical SAM superfamily enzyme YgiQ (UPF0313 family)
MWLSYAAGYMESRGHEIQLKDYTGWGTSMKKALEELEDFAPALIIMNTTTGSSSHDYKFAQEVRARLGSDVHISFVGTHVSAVPGDALENCSACDSVCRGEYELTSLDLVKNLDSKGSLSDIQGLSYRDSNGAVVNNPDRQLNQELDDLSMVSKTYKKYLNFRDYFYGHSRHPIVTIVAGRGCPHRCVFCVYPQTLVGHKYRKRDPVKIAEEMKYIQDNFKGVKEIMFEDDTLSLDKKHTMALCAEIIKLRIKIPWSANSRADIDFDTLKQMKKAGCRLLCVGFESGDQEMLDRMRKKISLERIRKFVKDSYRAGILIHGCFMVGNPGETRATLSKTMEFAKQINPDTAQFFPIMIYPGTEAYEWARKNRFITAKKYSDWITEEGLHNSVVSTPELSARDLVDWCDTARKEFYLRPRYLFYKALQVIRHPAEFKRNLMGFNRLLHYLFRGTFREPEQQCQN